MKHQIKGQNLSLTIHFMYKRKYIESAGFHLVRSICHGIPWVGNPIIRIENIVIS